MKLSTLVLAVSALLTAAAQAIHNTVTIPSLRAGSKLKAKGLTQAFQEHDVTYWKNVDNSIAMRQLVVKADANIDTALRARDAALKAIKLHTKTKAI